MIFKTLRQNVIINSVGRKIITTTSKFSQRVSKFLIQRWPVTGVLDCSFNGVPFRMYNTGDDGLTTYFYYDIPYHETSDLKLFTALAAESKIIVDIGANTGLYSFLSSIANRNSVIHAIEPYSVNAVRLQKNLDLNNCKNVSVNRTAMGDFTGEIELSVPGDGTVTDVSSVNVDFSKRFYPTVKWVKQSVPITTLDAFVAEKKIKPDLIKCDVESHEMEVFKGASNVLKTHRPLIIFECFLDEQRKEFFNNILRDYNYQACLILQEGLVHLDSGFVDNPDGLNYLLTPVKPSVNFLSFKKMDVVIKELFAGT